jgi:hypothetical protein
MKPLFDLAAATTLCLALLGTFAGHANTATVDTVALHWEQSLVH